MNTTTIAWVGRLGEDDDHILVETVVTDDDGNTVNTDVETVYPLPGTSVLYDPSNYGLHVVDDAEEALMAAGYTIVDLFWQRSGNYFAIRVERSEA